MKKRNLSVLLFALLAGALFAGTGITVEDAVTLALRNNISVERSKLALDGLNRTSDHAWNSLFPSLSLGTGGSKTDVNDFYSTWGSFSASVSVSAASLQGIKLAGLEYESGKITYETAARNVELAVRKAFGSLLYEEANVAVIADSVETARLQYEQTLANRKVGYASELDALSAQVTLENLKPALSSARVSYGKNLASFKQMIGADQDGEITLAGSLDDVQTIGAIDISGISAVSAAVLQLEKNLELAKIGKSLALSNAVLPVFSLSWTYRQDGTSREGSAAVKTGTASASVMLPLDGLLPWTKSNDSVDSASDTVKDIELQLVNGKTTYSITLKSLTSQIEQSLSAVKARKMGVALAETSVKMTAEAYRMGTKDLLTLQAANDARSEAQVALMREEYTLISTILELENEIGVPFGTLGR